MNPEKKHTRFVIIFLAMIFFDQLSKYWIRNNFFVDSSTNIIKGVFSLTYVKNTGVSFGMFKGYNWIFIIVAILALFFFVYLYLTEKRYRLQYTFILAGIIGNLIDRLTLGSVVDFFSLWQFPIFNIADSFISIGITWLIILYIKEEKESKSKKSYLKSTEFI